MWNSNQRVHIKKIICLKSWLYSKIYVIQFVIMCFKLKQMAKVCIYMFYFFVIICFNDVLINSPSLLDFI